MPRQRRVHRFAPGLATAWPGHGLASPDLPCVPVATGLPLPNAHIVLLPPPTPASAAGHRSVYPFHELIRATHIMHGVADAVEGPYNWTQYPPLPGGSNPAYLAYSEGGKTIHSVWQGGKIQVAETLEGPFTVLPHASYPGGNPAPVWHKGVFYLTNQRTTQIWSTPSLTQKWTLFANISAAPASVQHREDPFMWIDPRGYWHIINHAFTLQQLDHCGSSLVSIHSFSMDGRTWHTLDPVVQPYHHTVTWDDGTNHTYTTLERPNAQFNAQGAMTHINLAADLVTGDEGCKNRSAHCPAANPYCACTNCKYWDHAGSIIVALDV